MVLQRLSREEDWDPANLLRDFCEGSESGHLFTYNINMNYFNVVAMVMSVIVTNYLYPGCKHAIHSNPEMFVLGK